jgi:hypothetical protein
MTRSSFRACASAGAATQNWHFPQLRLELSTRATYLHDIQRELSWLKEEIDVWHFRQLMLEETKITTRLRDIQTLKDSLRSKLLQNKTPTRVSSPASIAVMHVNADLRRAL